MHLFREARAADEDAILDLARHLDTLNLPPERPFVHALLERSIASFDGRPEFDPTRRFLFVLEDPSGRVVGTSMIHAQHGTLDEPHVYFAVSTEERCATLAEDGRRVHMRHTMLYLSQTYDGPSEIGGLVLRPEVRRHPERLGRLLSLGRFLFVAAHRGWIRDRMLAEMLAPLSRGSDAGTRNHLWDAIGHRFTGLGYDEADRLSRIDKQFIWDLFPRMPVHVSLLPEAVQGVLGRVGDDSIAARRMLEAIGFEYAHQVDPFDGGPHLHALTDQVSLVRGCRRLRARAGDPGAGGRVLIGARLEVAPHFRAISTAATAEDSEVVLAPEAIARLGVAEGAELIVTEPPRA